MSGQGKATASLIPATAFGMKTAFIRCVTEFGVVLLSLAMLLGDRFFGGHWHKQECGLQKLWAFGSMLSKAQGTCLLGGCMKSGWM